MTRLYALAAVLGALTLGGVVHTVTTTSTPLTPPHHTRITEDDPRWDCRVMGNHLCGPDSRARAGGGYW